MSFQYNKRTLSTNIKHNCIRLEIEMHVYLLFISFKFSLPVYLDILDMLPIGALYFKFDFPTVCGQAPMTSFIEKIYMCIGAIN